MEPPVLLAIFSASVTLAIATGGWVYTHLHRLHFERRNDRLRFVEKQLNEFYGPLYVTLRVNDILVRALLARRQQEGTAFLDADAPRQAGHVSEWRIWVEANFMPANKRLVDLIAEKAHLIREEEMPECLLQFAAHVAGYQAIVERWRLGDFSEAVSRFAFPDDLDDYAERSYKDLKQEQLRLIGQQRRARRGGLGGSAGDRGPPGAA